VNDQHGPDQKTQRTRRSAVAAAFRDGMEQPRGPTEGHQSKKCHDPRAEGKGRRGAARETERRGGRGDEERSKSSVGKNRDGEATTRRKDENSSKRREETARGSDR